MPSAAGHPQAATPAPLAPLPRGGQAAPPLPPSAPPPVPASAELPAAFSLPKRGFASTLAAAAYGYGPVVRGGEAQATATASAPPAVVDPLAKTDLPLSEASLRTRHIGALKRLDEMLMCAACL